MNLTRSATHSIPPATEAIRRARRTSTTPSVMSPVGHKSHWTLLGRGCRPNEDKSSFTKRLCDHCVGGDAPPSLSRFRPHSVPTECNTDLPRNQGLTDHNLSSATVTASNTARLKASRWSRYRRHRAGGGIKRRNRPRDRRRSRVNDERSYRQFEARKDVHA